MPTGQINGVIAAWPVLPGLRSSEIGSRAWGPGFRARLVAYEHAQKHRSVIEDVRFRTY